MQLSDILEQLRKELQVAQFAKDTVQIYMSCIYNYLQYAQEQLKIDPIHSESRHICQWIAELKKKSGNPSRLIQHQAALKHFFSLLVKINVCDINPTDVSFPIRKVKSERNQPLHQDIVLKLLREMDRQTWIDERNFMILSILWALGLRLNELITLKVCDFEPEHDPKHKIGLLRVRGKGKKQRALFVVDKLYVNLVNYLNHPQSPKKKTDPLFPDQLNKSISGYCIQRMLKKNAQKLRITERITPHVLRHSFATEMYHQKVPLTALQALIGHDFAKETAIYVHISDELKKQALELIQINGRY